MGEPYEILVGPLEVYLAPVGESWPDVDTTPGGNWTLLGTNGKQSYEDSGVTVTHNQVLGSKRTAYGTGKKKVWRTEEDFSISFSLVDMTLETYAKILNNKTVTETAAASGTPGYKEINIYQGHTVNTFALLLKGYSPYDDENYYAQYQIPIAYQTDNPAPVFTKSDAAMLKCTWEALEDPNAASDDERFGKMVFQNAAALP